MKDLSGIASFAYDLASFCQIAERMENGHHKSLREVARECGIPSVSMISNALSRMQEHYPATLVDIQSTSGFNKLTWEGQALLRQGRGLLEKIQKIESIFPIGDHEPAWSKNKAKRAEAFVHDLDLFCQIAGPMENGDAKSFRSITEEVGMSSTSIITLAFQRMHERYPKTLLFDSASKGRNQLTPNGRKLLVAGRELLKEIDAFAQNKALAPKGEQIDGFVKDLMVFCQIASVLDSHHAVTVQGVEEVLAGAVNSGQVLSAIENMQRQYPAHELIRLDEATGALAITQEGKALARQGKELLLAISQFRDSPLDPVSKTWAAKEEVKNRRQKPVFSKEGRDSGVA